MLFDNNEEFESPFSKQMNSSSGTDNIRNSFTNAGLNKSSNTNNSNYSKTTSSNNLQKEVPKKRNIWDDEEIDDF